MISTNILKQSFETSKTENHYKFIYNHIHNIHLIIAGIPKAWSQISNRRHCRHQDLMTQPDSCE